MSLLFINFYFFFWFPWLAQEVSSKVYICNFHFQIYSGLQIITKICLRNLRFFQEQLKYINLLTNSLLAWIVLMNYFIAS